MATGAVTPQRNEWPRTPPTVRGFHIAHHDRYRHSAQGRSSPRRLSGRPADTAPTPTQRRDDQPRLDWTQRRTPPDRRNPQCDNRAMAPNTTGALAIIGLIFLAWLLSDLTGTTF